jgi:UDP-GlcNAc:undecaprenyl-phosphate GlcNAc-1-phosphate transferase
VNPLFFSMFCGAGITFLCIQLLRPVAVHIGLVDVPGGRKTHTDAIPLIGGVSVFLGFCFALLSLDISLVDYRGLLAGSAILVFIGVIDDFRELTPRTRLVGQCLAGVLLIEWGHIFLHHLGNMFFYGDVGLGVFSVLVTLLFVLGFVNAVNMIDGVDGLAGSIVLSEAMLLTFLNLVFHQSQNVYILCVLMATVGVFLGFNIPFASKKRARIFLGDAGSTFLGFLIAWFAIVSSQFALRHPVTGVSYNFVTVMWVIAYPMFDLVAVVIHRLASGKSAFSGGRDHFHFLLLDLKIKSLFVTVILFGVSLLLGLLGLLLAYQQVSEPWQLLIFVGVFLMYFCVAARLHASHYLTL